MIWRLGEMPDLNKYPTKTLGNNCFHVIEVGKLWMSCENGIISR